MTRSTVGIDVSAKELELAIWPDLQRHCFSNSSDGHRQIVDLLNQTDCRLVVIEATGGLERLCVKHLRDEEIAVEVVNPRQARDFASSLGYLEKTDAIDAIGLARFGQILEPSEVFGQGEVFQEFKALVRRREQLVEMRSAEKHRRSRVYDPGVLASINKIIEHFDAEIEAVEEKIGEVIADSKIEQSREILTSAPGVGITTAHSLLANLPELGHLNRKSIAKLGGLAPLSNDSGTHKGRRSCYGGRARVRTALYMASVTATRFCEPVRQLYQRLLDAGKDKSLALIASARKLLTMLNAMLKSQTSYQPQKALPKD